MATLFIEILLQEAESFFVCIVGTVYSLNHFSIWKLVIKSQRLMANKQLYNKISFLKFSGPDYCISLVQIRLQAHKAVHYQPLQVPSDWTPFMYLVWHIRKSPVGGKFVLEYTYFRSRLNCMQMLSF